MAWHCASLAALGLALAALLVTAEGGGNSTNDDSMQLLLNRTETLDACGCTTDTQGWSNEFQQCQKGGYTSCRDCPQQDRCAQIATLAGNGVAMFEGDCPSAGQGGCVDPEYTGLSYPTSITRDEQDNLYIADHGNNRVRMYVSSQKQMVTIAGTGNPGFSGDGGLGRNADLRKPEGIDVKPGVRLGLGGIGREVYFSDFRNQRIRKLVLKADGWFIYTVAGNGNTLQNPKCDDGCLGISEATLNHPRGLAFSSLQDLYIADSMNRKIRKLTTFLGAPDPARGKEGNLSTFVGRRSDYSSDMDDSFFNLASSFLPGQASDNNENVVLRTVHEVWVDLKDRLWFVDSWYNRIMMAPLYDPRPWGFVSDAYTYEEHYITKFLSRSFWRNPAAQRNLASTMKEWMTAEDVPLARDYQEGYLEADYQLGKTYWLFGSTTRGSWCPGLQPGTRDSCSASSWPSTRFQNLMGMCGGPTGTALYLTDAGSSEVVRLRVDLSRGFRSVTSSGQPLTTKDCKCMKYWYFDFESSPLPAYTSTHLSAWVYPQGNLLPLLLLEAES